MKAADNILRYGKGSYNLKTLNYFWNIKQIVILPYYVNIYISEIDSKYFVMSYEYPCFR